MIESGVPKLDFEEAQFNGKGEEIFFCLPGEIPLQNTDGRIIGMLGTYVDITDIKQAQADAPKKH
ncbi:MAG: hypothetical protein R2873_29060 [Caldilineaceae bacterium]